MKIQLHDINNSTIDHSMINMDTSMYISNFKGPNMDELKYETGIPRIVITYYCDNNMIRKCFYYYDRFCMESDYLKMFDCTKKDFKSNFTSSDLITITDHNRPNKKDVSFIKFDKYKMTRSVYFNNNSLFLKELLSSNHFDKFISKNNNILLVNKNIRNNEYTLSLKMNSSLFYDISYRKTAYVSGLLYVEREEVTMLCKFLEDHKIIIKDDR